MKYKLTTLASLFLILLISSCTESNFEADKEVIIAGKILNFEKHKEIKNFVLYKDDFFVHRKIVNVDINDDGLFQTSIPCHYKMEIAIRYSKASAYLICVPNDSIFLTIDADILNDSKSHYLNSSDFLKVLGSNRVDDSKITNEFLKRTRIKSSIEKKEAIKKYSPMEYLDYQNKLFQMKTVVLDSMLQTTNSEVFQTWAKDYLKYEKLDELMSYCRFHPKFNNISADSFNIPDEYFTAILSEDNSDTKVFSQRHFRFLNSYCVYLYRQAKKEGIDILEYINKNTTGFSKDMALAKYFYGLNKKSETLININEDLIESKYLKQLLTQEINIEEEKKAERLKIKTNSAFIDSLFKKYKGKVVYVDFWSTWCVPCMNEMPYSKTLQVQFKDKPIEFLFLGNQSKYENWQKTIKKKELSGTHVFLNDEQFAGLRSLFEIKGIPHYVFINKQGGFINNALRPSDKNIGKKINQLLNE